MADARTAKYFDPKTLQRIARLEVRARLVVEGFMSGGHESPYHGSAVEFAGHREYVPGDEIRHLDWRVWSKTDRLYIKQFEEDTNLTATLVVDASRSMGYGAQQGWSKFDYAATLAASLACLLTQKQDAAGLVTFHHRPLVNLPPSCHPSQLTRLLHELEQTQPDEATDVADVFVQLAGQIRQRGLVVLVSDLLVDLDALTVALRNLLLRKHEVIVFQVLHHDERYFPFDDPTQFLGMESAAQLRGDPRALREAYLAEMSEFCQQAGRLCTAAGADYVLLDTSEPLDAALARYLTFRTRNRRPAARS